MYAQSTETDDPMVWNGAARQMMRLSESRAWDQANPQAMGDAVFGGVPAGTLGMGNYSAPAFNPSPQSTSQSPTAPQQGTSTAQGYSGMNTGASMPAPLGGQAPLSNAVLQGYGMGLAPFNTNWYDNLGQSLYSQANKNFAENINPQIQGGAQLAGQYGGNRAALAQGTALGGLNQSVMNAMAPQYAQGYDNWLNRGVQTGQSAMQGLLGLGQLDVNSYNAQTGAAQAAAGAAGAPVYSNPWGAALGGALGLSQLGKLTGWWGN